MVYRVYVEKKPGLDNEARALKNDINAFLQIDSLEKVRVINRYDVENITKELFDYSIKTVFSEPQLDNATSTIDYDKDASVFAVEYLPGQFDQRADSASQCIQIISQGERPLVKTAKVYILYGNLEAEQLASIKKYVINPVESREASLAEFETLKTDYDIPVSVDTLDGFCGLDENGLKNFIAKYGLAMDLGDITFCRDYFRKEQRDPTITEIRMIDTYWSDHCRHTTFLTIIDNVEFEDETLQQAYNEYLEARKEIGRTKPINLMDIGTIAAKVLKKRGMLDKLDESDEINACTVKIKVDMQRLQWYGIFLGFVTLVYIIGSTYWCTSPCGIGRFDTSGILTHKAIEKFCEINTFTLHNNPTAIVGHAGHLAKHSIWQIGRC